MKENDRIFVAGSRGLVGSALVRRLQADGCSQLITTSSEELDLTNQAATRAFLEKTRPTHILVAAAKVGGIWANNAFPADFCYTNLAIQTHLIHGAYRIGAKKLLFLGSSCIYPKDSAIPVQEKSLLTGPLEPTNEAYALAKIAGVKMCDYYRRQYGCDFISAMPTNTYGPNDNYDLRMAHVVPSLIHKFHLAKLEGRGSVTVWGTGRPRRELVFVDDVADACVFLMQHYAEAGPINVGTGEDHSISEIAELIRKVVGFEGKVVFDPSMPDGVFRKVMDVSRIREMGWKPKMPLEEGLRKAYDWFAANYDRIAVTPA